MSSPRFVPSYWCEMAKEFGRVREASWKIGEADSDWKLDQLRVAQAHHAVILRLRANLLAHGWTIADYAHEVGSSLVRTGKMVRGEAILRLEDLAAMERLLDIRFLPQANEPSVLYPGTDSSVAEETGAYGCR